MIADICLHSASTALHCYLGSGSAAPVPLTDVGLGQSVLSQTSDSVAVEL